MKILQIINYPNKILKKVSEDVSEISKEFINDLKYTMYAHSGLGLSAIQVGNPQRVFVIDNEKLNCEHWCFVNPEVIDFSKEKSLNEEGCLSFPDLFIKVKRSNLIKMRALDINGNEFEIEADGLLAQCLSHEFDHLNGKLLFDLANMFDKKKIKKTFLDM